MIDLSETVHAANQSSDGRHDELDAVLRAQAVRSVASSARDAEECAMLLDMLGLDPAEARAK
jgi:hypothetical protein